MFLCFMKTLGRRGRTTATPIGQNPSVESWRTDH